MGSQGSFMINRNSLHITDNHIPLIKYANGCLILLILLLFAFSTCYSTYQMGSERMGSKYSKTGNKFIPGEKSLGSFP